MVDFLLIGPFSAATYKNVFPLIKECVISLGYNRVGEFSNGTRFGNTIWFTSLSKENPGFIELSKRYDDGYKKFDNYNAINVERTEDIPYDYSGVIGVPITFLERWNPEQFDVLRISANWLDDKFNGLKSQYIDGKKIYTRVFIRKRK